MNKVEITLVSVTEEEANRFAFGKESFGDNSYVSMPTRIAREMELKIKNLLALQPPYLAEPKIFGSIVEACDKIDKTLIPKYWVFDGSIWNSNGRAREWGFLESPRLVSRGIK